MYFEVYLHQNKDKIHCLSTERTTLLHIQQNLSMLKAVNYKRFVYSSRLMELPNAAEISSTVALDKRQGTEANTTAPGTLTDLVEGVKV